MPLLKPIVTEIFQEAGIVKPTNGTKFSSILDNHGLSLEATAERLRELADSSEDTVRLRANELVIKAHGALNDSEKETPNITFVMSGNVNLLSILTPR